jgi:hypothetical protein
MQRLGADVDALDMLCRKFHEEAGKIGQTIAVINGQVHSTWWEGNDARNFRNSWDGEFRARLTQIQQALETTGQRVMQQANAQRACSNN